MFCIFCKDNSDTSLSEEHIIPKSFGNDNHVLPRGWVCDRCNNYFAREVERPFLESDYGVRVRFEMEIRNRRGRVPVAEGFHPLTQTKIKIWKDEDGMGGAAANPDDEGKFLSSLFSSPEGSFWIPSAGEPARSYETSRFIAKIALEAFASRCVMVEGWNEELISIPELDEMREYVRRGRRGFVWPISMRRIYPAERFFSVDEASEVQVLHEFDILAISRDHGCEYFMVIAIFGIEYAINMGGPEIGSYLAWLESNGGASPLYSGKNPNLL